MFPRLIPDHTFFNDLFRDDYQSEHREFIHKIFHYIVLRQSIIEPKEKVSLTSFEIINSVMKEIGYPLWFLPYPQLKPKILLPLEDCIEISQFTLNVPDLNQENQIILLAQNNSNYTPTILISYCEKRFEQAVKFVLGNDAVSWSLNRKKTNLGFEILTPTETIEFIKSNEDNEILKSKLDELFS